MQQLSWKCTFFDALTPYEVYAVLKLRSEVFVVEQNCVFQDADDKDQYCFHLLGFSGSQLVAYARLVPSKVSYTYISIGRVVTSPKFRRAGVGKQLMQQAIHQSFQLFGRQTIKIGAQLYLKSFYESFGFRQSSEMYLEDDIPHIEMLKEIA